MEIKNIWTVKELAKAINRDLVPIYKRVPARCKTDEGVKLTLEDLKDIKVQVTMTAYDYIKHRKVMNSIEGVGKDV